jgi:hypothetical protein
VGAHLIAVVANGRGDSAASIPRGRVRKQGNALLLLSQLVQEALFVGTRQRVHVSPQPINFGSKQRSFLPSNNARYSYEQYSDHAVEYSSLRCRARSTLALFSSVSPFVWLLRPSFGLRAGFLVGWL